MQEHPRFNDVSFYQMLLAKCAVYDSIPFQFTTKTIPISKKTFVRLINLINESGFWNLSRVADCENIPTDAADFSLEAKTPAKYKIVSSVSCPDDNRKFTRACQEIIKCAGLDKEIRLIWGGEVKATDITNFQ